MRTVVAVVVGLSLLFAPAPAGAQQAPTHPGSLGPSATHRYVHAVYELFLDRPPTAAESVRDAHVVHRHGPAALTDRLSTSQEWAGVRIDALYHRILGRAPDPSGYAHWLAHVRGGNPIEAVAVRFHASAERYRQVGATPVAFVDSLYRDVLGRVPDPGGRAGWVAALARGAARTDVADGFYGSLESRRQRVDALYREVLGRDADPGGREHWAGQLPRLGEVSVAARFAASGELHRRVAGIDLPAVTVEPVGPGTAFPLAASWRPGCPVGPGDLRAVRFPHVRPDGGEARGVLIVHRDAVAATTTLVRAAWGTRFPITQARPVDDFGGDDDASMAADNSSAFNCRRVAGTSSWSRHAYGRAIDLNPVANPHVQAGRFSPPAGAAFADRRDVRPGMLVEGSGVVDAADRIGWGWGGRWSSFQDHQHLSADGR